MVDHIKKIEQLLSENGFLQLQLEDLNDAIQRKDKEISVLNDITDTAAYLQSKIDANLEEIEQLKYNSEIVARKAEGIEMMNEELEISLLKEMKEKQKGEAVIKEMDSVKANMNSITEELEEAVSLYKKVQQLKAELAEAKSVASILETENAELKAEREELQELIKMLKSRKADNM